MIHLQGHSVKHETLNTQCFQTGRVIGLKVTLQKTRVSLVQKERTTMIEGNENLLHTNLEGMSVSQHSK